MSEEVTHSKLPWATGGSMEGQVWSEETGHTVAIATMTSVIDAAKRDANAAFIVKAVNNHDALLDAAKSALSLIESEWGACDEHCDSASNDCCTFCRVNAAIQSATGSK